MVAGGPPSCRYNVDEGISKSIRSTHKRAKRPIFGSESKTFVDECWNLKDNSEQPGPGAYSLKSDFGSH